MQNAVEFDERKNEERKKERKKTSGAVKFIVNVYLRAYDVPVEGSRCARLC